VLVNGELWRARASGPIAKGAQAKVVSVENLRVSVEMV